MSQEKYDIFISYSRKDSAVADKICLALDNAGITYFIDRQGIGGGFEFPAVLAENIVNSKLFLLLASKNVYESNFTRSEIIFAFNKKAKNAILPYIIDNSSLPIDLEFVFAGINWRNITDHPIDTVLVDDLLRLLGRERKVVPPTVADDEVNTPEHKISLPTFNRKRLLVLVSVIIIGFLGYLGVMSIYLSEKYDLYSNFWFCRDFSYVMLNDKIGYINRIGKEIVPCKYDMSMPISEGLVSVGLNGKWGFIDKTGKEVIPFIYDFATTFSEGLAVVGLNGKRGFIDKTGKEVISSKYDEAYEFHKGLAPVQLNGKWGYINKIGEEVIPLIFDEASLFLEEGVAYVELDGEKFFIDKEGNRVE